MDTNPTASERLNRFPSIRSFGAYPSLTEREEQKLCHRWRDHHEISAAQQLVACHVRLVLKIAKGYRHYGCNLDDLVGEGYFGLMRALCRFDPDREARFATYAKWWVVSTIQEYILHTRSLAKIGTSEPQKELAFNLRRLRCRIDEYEHGNHKSEGVLQAMCSDMPAFPQVSGRSPQVPMKEASNR